jgi:hypothetical protein
MEPVREAWTDARLDDFRAETARRFDELGRRVDNGFNRIDADLREMRLEAIAQRKEMSEGFEAMNERFEGRFEAMNRLLIQLCGGIIVALIGLVATQL